jgi:hypothetical protein
MSIPPIVDCRLGEGDKPMQVATTPALTTPTVPPRASRWAGRVLSGIPAAFLVLDVAIKFANIPSVAEQSLRLGLSPAIAPGLGVLLAVCLGLYLVPRTAVLGAVLLTGYLGGAVAIHLRVGDPLASHTLFPVYVGALLWAGLYLRDARVRAAI